VDAALLQRGVIHDIEGRFSVTTAATALHYAEKLLGDTQQQTAPVVVGIEKKTVKAVLPDLHAQQAEPPGLVETEHAYLEEADKQQVQKQCRARNSLLFGDMSLKHQLAETEFMTNGYDFLANTIFFAQNVAQLGNFA
jgi:hypothetical protein